MSTKEEKKEFSEKNNKGLFGTAVEPRRSFQSFLRTHTKILISAVSILDRKGAVLIRINTTLITATIVFGSYIDEQVKFGGVISSILLVGLIISLFLAILGQKPTVTEVRKLFPGPRLNQDIEIEQGLFLQNSMDTDYEKLEEAAQKVVHSQDLQIRNQLRAMHMLSVHNECKAALIDKAYTVFIVTFILVCVSTLVFRFI